MKAALLPDRGVVKVTGETARSFLHGLVTVDTDTVTPTNARFAALLTPQGKVIADFIIAEAEAEDGGGFFIDAPRALAATLATKLTFYKLRAKVSIQDVSEELAVMAVWDGNPRNDQGLTYRDPRSAALGWRIVLPRQQATAAASALAAELVDAPGYEAHRIALGIPRGGIDFIYGDAFPHETDIDQLAGVDFDKGCYVGQEVVSRVRHRASARTRVIPVTYEGAPPEPGTPVMAGDKTIGTMGSASGGRGLAMLRLDRVEDALAAGTPLMAGSIAIRPVKPDWATFPFPGDKASA